ncbi:hypothetical protein B0H11DRAFT_1669525, partial [Mycena galericulata]
VHAHNGVNSVTLSGYAWPDSDARIIQTTKDLPGQFPFVLDMNAGVNRSGSNRTSTTEPRSSSATSYLAPRYISRLNLHILLHAQVSRVLQSRNNSLHFNSVDF